MQPTNVDSNNTGLIHIAKGYQPVATVGHINQGEALIQSAVIEELKTFPEDIQPFKGQIWATASTSAQTVIVTEETEERLA